MPAINVELGGDHEQIQREMGCDRRAVIQTQADWTVDAIENGMSSGRTSLMLLIPADVDGLEVVVVAETSLQAWMMATAALHAAHREEVEQPGWAVISAEAKAVLMPRYAEAIRRVLPGTTRDQSEELAAMFIDAWTVGAPPEAFE